MIRHLQHELSQTISAGRHPERKDTSTWFKKDLIQLQTKNDPAEKKTASAPKKQSRTWLKQKPDRIKKNLNHEKKLSCFLCDVVNIPTHLPEICKKRSKAIRANCQYHEYLSYRLQQDRAQLTTTIDRRTSARMTMEAQRSFQGHDFQSCFQCASSKVCMRDHMMHKMTVAGL